MSAGRESPVRIARGSVGAFLGGGDPRLMGMNPKTTGELLVGRW